jgi:hypothetical protein
MLVCLVITNQEPVETTNVYATTSRVKQRFAKLNQLTTSGSGVSGHASSHQECILSRRSPLLR